MKNILSLLIILILILLGCEKEPVNGHLKVTVTYPEAVVVPDQITYFKPVPAYGAEVRLYDKDAICLGYKDAMLNLVKVGDTYTMSEHLLASDKKGEVLFTDIPSGEYFLIVFARELYKYSEKYIEIIGGDTLELVKDFTPAAHFTTDLEPWDYEMPGY